MWCAGFTSGGGSAVYKHGCARLCFADLHARICFGYESDTRSCTLQTIQIYDGELFI